MTIPATDPNRSSKIRAKRQALEALWKQGLAGKPLLHEHSDLIDAAISQACQTDLKDKIAVVATGGYGRRELFPYSDIDLMLLHDNCSDQELNQAAEKIFYPLWDAGLEVGHGVRTIDQCLAEANKDFFLQVSILDARLVAGSPRLLTALNTTFKNSYVEGKRKDFIKNMLHHRRKRHQDFGNHTYLLEPHIKQARGGFRDLQTMLWSARILFGLNSLKDMHDAALLSPYDFRNLQTADENLTRVRNRLHYISGRKNDQLYFEHQEEMARAFNYKDQKGLLAVEQFMRDTYSHLQVIAITTELFFEHATEVMGLSQSTRSDKKLEKGLAIRQGRVHLTDESLLKTRPHLLMRLFSQAATNTLPVYHRSKNIIRSRLDLISTKVRRSKRMGKALTAILLTDNPLPITSDLLETGILAAYIPEFNHLRSLAQHDIYHVFTVDRHLIQTVAELAKLRKSEENIYQLVASPATLMLAGLLHDIGKGYGGNHPQKGAELTKDISKRIGLNTNDSKDLAFLVREHLFLSQTALRRDLDDENLTMECARKIKTQQRLAMLFLLTIADAKATGPSSWSDWKSALLLELYLKIANALEQGDTPPPDPAKEGEWMKAQLHKLLIEKNLDFDLAILPADYLLSFTPSAMLEHIEQQNQLTKDKITVNATTTNGFWSISIIAHDRPGILNRICGVMALHGLKILAAQIYTWNDGSVVDTIDAVPLDNKNFADQDWTRLSHDLKQAINLRLGLNHRLAGKIKTMVQVRPGPQQDKPQVIFNNQTSANYTVIEVYAKDRLGLLYHITRTLTDFGINTSRAKISNRRDQAADVFYVQDSNGEKITDKDFQEEITNDLLHSITAP